MVERVRASERKGGEEKERERKWKKGGEGKKRRMGRGREGKGEWEKVEEMER